ncbi:MAG TPA: exosortase/archaeosortase family protein [Verrucomicrobiae bacterium]|nr:exosortase/archaeosortase family protein [Verrucomicrobiae bacterium]
MNNSPISETPRDWWPEMLDCWQRLPNKGFFFVLLAAWLMLFHFLGNSVFGYIHDPSLLYWMYNAYNSQGDASDDGYGNLIPFLVVGLFWWKRRELLALPLKLWPPALLLVGLGLGLHILGYMIQQPRLSIVALFTGIYGLMGLAWGPAWLRHSFFPFCLFIFSVPLSIILEPITFPLRLLVSTLVEWIAHGFLGIGVMRMGTQLFDPLGTYQYDVAAACSGIRSLTAIFLFATVWGFIVFRSPWKRGLMMVLAVPFAVLGNLLRMLLIIVAAVMGGQSWGNYVHEGCPIHLPFSLPLIGNEIAIVNLLPYVPAFVGLLLIARWLEEKPDPAGDPPS